MLGALAWVQREGIGGWLGPPRVTMNEAYAAEGQAVAFDHSKLDGLLKRQVDKDGWVDYRGLTGEAEELDGYILSLRDAPFEEMGRDERLALLINAYNAFTLRMILDYYPVRSIRDIPAKERWEAKRWQVGGYTWSLDEIEHKQIRPKFAEPRIHFALVCAAIGCPRLRNEAYAGARIEEQLEDQARYLHGNGRWFRYEKGARVAELTKLYDWYGGDFEQAAGTALAFAARYSPALKSALSGGARVRVRYLDYDWTLNDVANRPVE